MGLLKDFKLNDYLFPHLMQVDTTTQAIADVAAAQVITFDTDLHHEFIKRTSSSRFTIERQGSYLISFSGTGDLAIGTNEHLEVWLRINGTDVAHSNTRIQLVGNIEVEMSMTIIEHFKRGDYFEFWTWGSSTSCRWLATAVGSTPTRPACPSVTITCNQLSDD